MNLIILLLMSLLKSSVSAVFSNQVEYPPESSDNTYRYEFEITKAITMSIWNETRKTYRPVVKINGSFYFRNRISSSACSSLIPVEKFLEDSIIKAAGRHRYMLLVNKQFPGTPIVVPINSQIEVKIRNNLVSEAVSFHWHGQTQKGTFYMDGVSRVTQCAIGPGESFVYKFRANDVGTHFYHAHVGMQRNEGLYGPLIVTDKVSANVYEKEFYFHIHDWYQESSSSLYSRVIWEEMRFTSGFEDLQNCYDSNRVDDGTAGVMLPFNRKTDAILINGKGSFKIMDQVRKLKEVDQVLGSQAFDLDLEEFEVIGANAGHQLEIRIGGHKLYVVATDGNPIKTIETDSLIVNGGERFDFYINTKGPDNNRNYFIMVRTLETKDAEFGEIWAENFGLAVLKYSNVNASTAICGDACHSCDLNNRCTKVNCPFWSNPNDGIYTCIPVSKLRSKNIPVSDLDLLKNAYSSTDFEEYFFNFHFAGAPAMRSSINGIRFMMPSIPLFFRKNHESLLKTCSPVCFNNSQSCQCSHLVEIGTNKVIQFVLYNMGNGAGIEGNSHPIHLHGHNFYVIHMGFPSYHHENFTYKELNRDLNCDDDNQACSQGGWRDASWKFGRLPDANLVDPPLKDTIVIPVGGYAVIRFKSNNIGYWMMHCHIDIHHGEGMAMIIQEGRKDEIEKLVNYDEINLCENNLEQVKILKSHFQVSANPINRLLEMFVSLLSTFFTNKN